MLWPRQRKGEVLRALLLKFAPEEDFYVGWSESGEEPVWYGDRAEASHWFAPDSLARADLNGTSSMPLLADGTPWEGGPFYAWDQQDGPNVRQRGVLPRRFLRAFTLLYLGGEEQAAFDLLEPFDDPDGERVLHAH